MKDSDLCPMSDLPPEQCALSCHRNEQLLRGLRPAEEPVRGVEPSGVRVWPPLAAAQHEPKTTTVVMVVDRLGHTTMTALPAKRRPRPKQPAVRCHYAAELSAWCTPEHTRDCRSAACLGCKPCEHDHCELRGSCPNHVNHAADLWTCPQCIGTVRTQIADIVDKAVLVAAEMEYAGVDSEATTLAGAAAAPEQFDEKRARALQADQTRGWCDYPMRPEVYAPLDRHHPYAVLARWENYYRDTYDTPNTRTVTTITSAAGYLTKLLATKVPHRDVFPDFARDIAHCHTHLEEVLSDSRRPEMGAPCPKCADLTRHDPDRRAPRLQKRHDEGDRTGASDLWVCPEVPTHRWHEADYRIRIADDYLTHAARLTADHMRRQWGIEPSTLRTWAERGQVHRRGTDGQGRLMYDVRDARLAHDRQRGLCDWPRLTDLYPIEREQATA